MRHAVRATWYVPLGTRHLATWYEVDIIAFYQLSMLTVNVRTRHTARATQYAAPGYTFPGHALPWHVLPWHAPPGTRHPASATRHAPPGTCHLAHAT